MPIKALIFANAAMIMFVMMVLMQSYVGMNASGLITKMHQQGLVKESAMPS